MYHYLIILGVPLLSREAENNGTIKRNDSGENSRENVTPSAIRSYVVLRMVGLGFSPENAYVSVDASSLSRIMGQVDWSTGLKLIPLDGR